jgi:tetratricopeptide (TPR) repeat protein
VVVLRTWLVALLASLFVVAAPLASAHAQSVPASDRAEARSLFAAGQAAVEAGRWTDALDAFHRAYVLTHSASALFNAAFALRALGRYQDAEVAFEELLALDGLRPAMRTESEEYLAEIRRRIARVALEGLPDDAITTVRLDGDGQEDDGSRPLVLRADPGHHAIDVSLTGHTRFEWSGALTDGQTLHVAVSLPLEGASSRPLEIYEEAWFWVVVGVGALAIGGAIAGGIVADQQAQLTGESGMVLHL